MILDRFLESQDACSGPLLVLALADNVSVLSASAVLKWLPIRERIQRI